MRSVEELSDVGEPATKFAQHRADCVTLRKDGIEVSINRWIWLLGNPAHTNDRVMPGRSCRVTAPPSFIPSSYEQMFDDARGTSAEIGSDPAVGRTG